MAKILFHLFIVSTLSFLPRCTPTDHSTPHDVIELQAADTVLLFGPGIISSSRNERDIAISPDRQEIMYTLATYDNSFRAIVQLKLKENTISERQIAPFSGAYNDIEPFYSPDGKRLFFCSTRPLHEKDSTKDYNIWYTEKINGQWSENAIPVGEPINTEADEYFPSLAENGNLYFTSTYPDSKGLEDIYVSAFEHGQYNPPVSLGEAINSSNYEFNAYVSPNEDLILFSSYGRDDDLGGGDLYLSTKDSFDHWSQARNLGPQINSAQLDYCPFIDYNTASFYFTSNRKPPISGKVTLTELESYSSAILNGAGNIYFVNLEILGRM